MEDRSGMDPQPGTSGARRRDRGRETPLVLLHAGAIARFKKGHNAVPLHKEEPHTALVNGARADGCQRKTLVHGWTLPALYVPER